MGKIFLKVEDGGRVTLMHYMPFDPVEGMGHTEVELAAMGVLIEESQVPQAEHQSGKVAAPYYTPEDGLYWVYTDVPMDGPATGDDIQAINAKLDYMGMMLNVM